MNRRHLLLLAIATLVIAILLVVLLRSRIERRRAIPRFDETAGVAPAEFPPVESWTKEFATRSGDGLRELLDEIERRDPGRYRDWELGFLHGRALIDAGDEEAGAQKLEPFTAKEHPWRDLALHHRASAMEDENASRERRLLIFEHPQSHYREEAIEDEVAWLTEEEDPAALVELARRLEPTASSARRRELSSRIAELQMEEGEEEPALARALAILRAGTSDDAADRAARTIDRPAIVSRLSAPQLALLGETMQAHRHFERAIEILRMAIARAPSDDLQFALGRSHFGAEQYAEAQKVYQGAAATAKTPAARALFHWHAARSAQLQGNDAEAERLMTAAIAVKGTFPATTAALTQRIRTRTKLGRLPEAAADLALLRRIASNRRAFYEGSLPLALGRLAAGDPAGCIAVLDAIPRALIRPADRSELAYWRARANESRDPSAAVRGYLDVLRSTTPTQYQTFARQRLDSAALREPVARERAARSRQAESQEAEKKIELARELQADVVHLSRGPERAAALERLRAIYRADERYREVLDLQPEALPRFPQAGTPFERLMAMALYDDASPGITERWELRPPAAALTRSRALNLGGASRDSIYAIEVMMRSVPADFHRELLPPLVRELLHPRYFATAIEAEAARHDADPALVLAIMREESRFNPRAKSAAAARGLLQFIITTARDVGADIGLVDLTPEDLYDPRTIIRLGAKYVGELAEQFDGNGYRIAASYNAGPKQTALWSRLQAAPGDDYFLAAVNFDETKDYIRKVMNSWEKYSAQ